MQRCAAGMSARLETASLAEPPAPELRLVLLGKTGVGKSSTGNAILGREAFRANVSPSSITSCCETQRGRVCGRQVTVIDTPGFFHTRLPNRDVSVEVSRSVTLCDPGPHAFVVVIQPGRFTPEQWSTLDWVEVTFGEGVLSYTLVLLTWAEPVEGEKVAREFLAESEELAEFVKRCGGGCLHLSKVPAGRVGEEQVELLLAKVEQMVEHNGGGCYTCGMLQRAERDVQQAQESVLREGGGQEEEDEEEEKCDRARRKAEKLFWRELVFAMGQGAAEGAGLLEKGKSPKKGKVVQRAAALAATPLSLTSAARAVGGAVREGSKVLYKHRKTLLQRLEGRGKP